MYVEKDLTKEIFQHNKRYNEKLRQETFYAAVYAIHEYVGAMRHSYYST